MAGNPYHDADGKFCAKDTASKSYENAIAEAKDHGLDHKAEVLQSEYEAMMIMADPTGDVAQKALQRDYGTIAKTAAEKGKVKTASQRKKLPTTKTVNVDNHAFRIVGEESKTPKEFREYLTKLDEKYKDGEVEQDLKRDILHSMNLFEYSNDDWDLREKITIDDNNINISKYIGSISKEDDSFDASDYVDLDILSNKNYTGSSSEVVGYYNEQEVTSHLSIPDEYAENVAELNNYKNYQDEIQRANNPNLPDWATLPKNTSVTGTKNIKREPQKWNNQSCKYLDGGIIVGDEVLKKPSTNSGIGRIRKLKNIAENDKEIARLINRNIKVRENYETTRKQIAEIAAYEQSANKRAFVFEETPNFKKTTETQRRKYLNKLHNAQENTITETGKNSTKIDILRKVTDQQKDKARQEIREIEDKNKAEWKDYSVKKLSTYYPHSSEKVRLQEAEKWINKNPDLIGQDF